MAPSKPMSETFRKYGIGGTIEGQEMKISATNKIFHKYGIFVTIKGQEMKISVNSKAIYYQTQAWLDCLLRRTNLKVLKFQKKTRKKAETEAEWKQNWNRKSRQIGQSGLTDLPCFIWLILLSLFADKLELSQKWNLLKISQKWHKTIV